jgi:ribonuclease PH
MLARGDGRSPSEMRPVSIERGFLRWPEGSALISVGMTRVVCSATVQDGVPPFLRGSGTGWVTAAYGMLPASTETRVPRERILAGARTQEIRRFIGRSLRAVITLWPLGERTIHVDCDVLDADGGTRTAAVTGAYVALYDALVRLQERELLGPWPLKDFVAGASVGLLQGNAVLDLTYAEDRQAEVDLNVVVTGCGEYVELQGTAEKTPFGRQALDDLLELASKGVRELVELQKKVLGVERADAAPVSG